MNGKLISRSFTIHRAGRIREIITDIGVSLPFDPTTIQQNPNQAPPNPIYQTRALWDTGATNCAITQKLAQNLSLKPITVAEVHHANGVDKKNVYLISLFLPNQVAIVGIRATECESTAGAFDVILGMDIIGFGDFAITSNDGNTTFSFGFPSMSIIDFSKKYGNWDGQVNKEELSPDEKRKLRNKQKAERHKGK